MHSSLRIFLPFYWGLLVLLSTVHVSAQIEVTAAGTGVITPENLITNVFLGQGVEVTSLQYQGADPAVGYFTNGQSDIGIDRGIVMSSGLAITAATENSSGSTTGNTSGTSITDPDLAQIANAGIQDVAIYTIKFIPINDTLRFKFAFASEEYPEWACSAFNDAFGFFISGPGINGPFSNNGQNIALVPDPADPTGLTFTNVPVTINNVNGEGVNAPGGCLFDYGMYYNDNTGSTTLTYDGYLDVFTAQAVVIPCQEYTIKLAICDRGDPLYDSAVFLEAKSFGTGALQTNILTTSLDFTIAEGCDPGFFEISLPLPADEVVTLDYTILGDATPGIDYEAIPTGLVIPAGDTSVVIPVVAFEDGLQEGTEQVCIDIQLDPCNRDTFCITIRDKLIVKPNLGPDTAICSGSALQLDASLDIALPPPALFSSQGDLVLSPVDAALFSEIEVAGVLPGILQEGVVKQVCLDTIIHPWLDDLDIYLIAPGGQFVELTTDNGANGDNYIGTCFTLDAPFPINTPGPFAPADSTPFTGNYLPEGVWSDLWDGNNPTNGTWRLQIVDDANGFTGTLRKWSICFEPIYALEYEWDPAPGLSCYDCPNPVAQPDSTTSYVVRVTDSYGCETRDTIVVAINNDSKPVIDQVVATPASCIGVDDGGITVLASGQNQPFLFNLDGGALSDSGVFDNLAAGIYEVQVLGATGCVATQLVEVAPADTLFLDLQVAQPVTCDSGNDGVVVAQASGGSPAYFYVWDDGTQSDTISEIGRGTYRVTATDAKGCQVVDSLFIDDPSPVTVLFSVTNVQCFQTATGAATAVPMGGDGNYQFLWDSGAGNQATATATNLAAGGYTVTVTDGNGCTAVGSATVIDAAPAQMVLNAVNISCNGNADGLASATALGGAGGFTYAWSSGNQGSLQTGLKAGTYVVTATDQNGCSIIDSVVLAQPDSLAVVAVAVDSTSCANAADGGITFSVSGGTPIGPGGGYTYLWNDNGSQDSVRSDLSAGMYSVTVVDARGCQASAIFEVESPEPILLSVTVQEASCSGNADGGVEVMVEGGTPQYVFAWSNGSTGGPVLQDLTPGDYTVTVTDARGCTESIQAQVNSPSGLISDLTVQNVSCFGEADGAAALMVSGGTPGYVISWSNSQTGPTAALLEAGDYSVTVEDQQGCKDVLSFSISQPDSISAQLDVNLITCQGAADASIEIFPSGGTPPWTPQWSNGVTGPSSITGLGAGQYAVTITDANGCSKIYSATFDDPPALEVTLLDQGDVSCFGGSDGQLLVVGTGGTGPLSYSWSGGLADTAALGNLPAGLYFLTLADANGCQLFETYEIVQPPLIEIETTVSSDILCFGDSSGALAVAVTGGVEPYVYSWNNGGDTAFLSGLPAGVYTLSLTDANGCPSDYSVELTEPEALSLSLEPTHVACFGEQTGAVMADISGGTGPYQPAWSYNGAFFSSAEDLDEIPAGTYTLQMVDANGCTVEGEAEVLQPDEALTVGLAVGDTICFGASNGSVSATAQGGTGPYVYTWSNGQTSPEAVDLPAGQIQVTVTDNLGCTTTAVGQVAGYGAITASLQPTPPACHQGADGNIVVDDVFYNGVAAPIGAFSFAWSTTPVQTGPLSTGLSGDQTYQVTITNAAGCSAVAEAYLLNPTPVEVEVVSTTDASCNGGADGTATVQASGGAGGHTYLWDSSAGSQSGAMATGLGPGSYMVTASDANGCTAVTGLIIDEPTTMVIAGWEVTNVQCFGDADGSLRVTVEGGNPPYTSIWSNGTQGFVANGLPAGLYTVTITDLSGCTISADQEVSEPSDQILPTVTWRDVTCFGYQDGSIFIAAVGGTEPYTFSLNGRDFSFNPNFLNLPAGSYPSIAVRDANGCVAFADTVTVFEPPRFEVDLGPGQTILFGDSIQLMPLIVNAQGAVLLEWETNDTLFCEAGDPECQNPWVSPRYRGEYRLTVIDSNGCRAFDDIIIDVDLEKGFYVPTGFTPNGDGLNDVLRSHGRSDIEVVFFRVYDRWGELLFDRGGFRADEGVGWDGTFGGQEMPTGLYIWYAEVEYENGRRELFQGESQMIR